MRHDAAAAIAPRFLPAVAALFWGWQTGLFAIAVPAAVALEARHWTRVRWEVAPIGFQRVADLCTWTFLIVAGYYLLGRGLPVQILPIVQWLPLVLLPLVLVQSFSTAGRIDLAALFVTLRRDRGAEAARRQVDLVLPFVIVCVLAAGAANVRSRAFFAGTAVLALWTLWVLRPRRRAVAGWVLAAVLALGMGYAGHLALSRLQGWVFNLAIDYLDTDRARTDPYRAATDIGHIGELKSSERILLRVTPAGRRPAPLLLHRASYDAYVGTSWVAREAPFEAVPAAADAAAWALAPAPQGGERVLVSETLPRGRGVLSLPLGAARIEGLTAHELRRNRLGTVQVERAPGAVSYTVAFGEAARPRDAPGERDLRIAPPERAAIEAVASALGLPAMAPAAALRAVHEHFAANFRYSTFRARHAAAPTALADFLQHNRSGHCEYFATATVLLARAAGIPARYATGWSVQEWSGLEGRYVVRERHAHAWARVWIDGAWHDLDTTPPQWFGEEAQQASPFEPVRDLWSWLVWRLGSQGRPEQDGLPAWALWALLPLFAVLAWRIHRTGGFARRRQDRARARPASLRAGADSPFYRVEARLAALGCPRAPHEAFGEWIERAGRCRADVEVEPLRALLALHYRARFDPVGLAPVERAALDAGVERWLGVHRTLRAAGVATSGLGSGRAVPRAAGGPAHPEG